jgi:hypothetical protein
LSGQLSFWKSPGLVSVMNQMTLGIVKAQVASPSAHKPRKVAVGRLSTEGSRATIFVSAEPRDVTATPAARIPHGCHLRLREFGIARSPPFRIAKRYPPSRPASRRACGRRDARPWAKIGQARCCPRGQSARMRTLTLSPPSQPLRRLSPLPHSIPSTSAMAEAAFHAAAWRPRVAGGMATRGRESGLHAHG